MWILTREGSAYDIEGCWLIPNGNTVELHTSSFHEESIATMATSEEAKDEIRKIMIAITSGCVVYEIGKGFLGYTSSDGIIKSSKGVAIMVDKS